MTAEQMYNEWRECITIGARKLIPMWYELPECEKQAWESLARKCQVTLSNHRCLDREIPDQRARHAELEAKYARLQVAQDADVSCTCGTSTVDPQYHLISCDYRRAHG